MRRGRGIKHLSPPLGPLQGLPPPAAGVSFFLGNHSVPRRPCRECQTHFPHVSRSAVVAGTGILRTVPSEHQTHISHDSSLRGSALGLHTGRRLPQGASWSLFCTPHPQHTHILLPRTVMRLVGLEMRERLVWVTWGHGGTTRERSRQGHQHPG